MSHIKICFHDYSYTHRYLKDALLYCLVHLSQDGNMLYDLKEYHPTWACGLIVCTLVLIVVCTLNGWSDEIMGIWRNCVHVSVVSPLLGDMDRYGVAMGVASTAAKLFCRSYKSTLYGRWQSYAFFMPSAECLEELSLLIDQKKINPLVQNVYGFSHLPEAYSKVGQSNGAGKVVIDHTKK
ncbi:zinc-binding dehydrogenase domain-containing protein [Ditylenchus destructor]|nr:zinc-binding dehydrogenase domain-containing protein [Ditylenchus destructor]